MSLEASYQALIKQITTETDPQRTLELTQLLTKVLDEMNRDFLVKAGVIETEPLAAKANRST